MKTKNGKNSPHPYDLVSSHLGNLPVVLYIRLTPKIFLKKNMVQNLHTAVKNGDPVTYIYHVAKGYVSWASKTLHPGSPSVKGVLQYRSFSECKAIQIIFLNQLTFGKSVSCNASVLPNSLHWPNCLTNNTHMGSDLENMSKLARSEQLMSTSMGPPTLWASGPSGSEARVRGKIGVSSIEEQVEQLKWSVIEMECHIM